MKKDSLIFPRLYVQPLLIDYKMKEVHLSVRRAFRICEFDLAHVTQSIKGTVMQIEKALINDGLRVSKVSGKFRIPTVYNFPAIYLVAYFLTASHVFIGLD